MKECFIDNLNCLCEIHLHLDGAISVENAKSLAKLQGIEIPKNDDEIKELLTVSKDCKDLTQFLEKFEFPGRLLQTKEGITRCVSNLLEELSQQGLSYAEIRFAPQLSLLKGLTQEEVVLAAIEGLKNSKIEANLILCAMRGSGNDDQNFETLKLAKKYLNKGVCGFDIAGAEALFKTEHYEILFEEANKLNVPFTIHAGEADGPSSVYSALKVNTRRIGHGVRSIEDENLMKILSNRKVFLEVCPTSNIKTCAFKEIKDLPIQKFIDNNILFSINTDDPSVCDTTLKDEWRYVIEEFNLSKERVKEILINTIKYSFASEEVKLKIINLINKEFENN